MHGRLCVLLPVRNGAALLSGSLDSLAAQRFRAFRVVAVDDGSEDATPEILARTASEWRHADGPHLTVLRLDPGRGIAGALAAAADEAISSAVCLGLPPADLLARQDADDRSLPERFERQIAWLDAHPGAGLVATGIRTVSASAPTDGWRRYEAWLSACHTPEEIERDLWIESPLPHPTVMMRRSAYERAGGYRDVPWPEDYDLWLRMLEAGIPMAKLPDVLYEWRDHPGRASRTLPAYTPAAFLACRAHHLARHLRGRPVIVWGAGRDGRRAARALLAEGSRIDAFLDIDPRKIGRTAYGRPILGAEDWLRTARTEGPAGAPVPSAPAVSSPAVSSPIVLAAVGTAGARELIRARLEAAGFREGTGFLCIA